MGKQVVVSGTRPTGGAHLGTYFGAIQNFVKMHEDPNLDTYFFIADYHSLTTHPKAEELNRLTFETVATYLACGLDPEKCTLYFQSDLPQIPELYLLLNMMAYKGELEKTTSFKDKIRKKNQTINAGLLTYPVLMSADIIIHRAHKVPVGKDQEQHLEMTRTFANRFNNLYGEVFPEPVAYNFGDELVKVPGLDGSGKMGKSEGANNAIFLLGEEKANSKKIMRAKTDAGPTEKNAVKPVEIENLFNILKLVSDKETLSEFETAYNNCEIRYGDLKKAIATNSENFIAPIRAKANELMANKKDMIEILQEGKKKANKSANETIALVREKIGINYY